MPVHPRGVLGHRQPPGRQRAVGLVQRLRAEALGAAEAVADHAQRAARGDPRVLLPQRAGRGVARIGERRLALRDQAGVELREVGDAEEHLAAHLEQLRAPGTRRCAVSRSGMSSMVRTLSVTSSPVRPSPRVAARTSLPSRYTRRSPRRRSSARTGSAASPPISLGCRPAQAASSSAENTLSRLSIRSRWSAAVNSVAKPARRPAGSASRACAARDASSSSACSSPQQRVELAVGHRRRVQDVVAELVLAHLVGEFLPAAAQIGVGGVFGLFGQRLRASVALGLTLAGYRRAPTAEPEASSGGTTSTFDIMQVNTCIMVGWRTTRWTGSSRRSPTRAVDCCWIGCDRTTARRSANSASTSRWRASR